MIHLYPEVSQISGTGLFTTYPIPKGTLIGVFQGLEPEEEEQFVGDHSLPMPDGSIIYMTDNFKYLNHSDDPSVALYDDYTVVALKDIPSNHELTCDYGDEWKEFCGHKVY